MRGGRRPGAGAPKGNYNALRTGKQSHRMRAVMNALLLEPEESYQSMAGALYAAGFAKPYTKFTGDLRGVVDFLYDRWFVRKAHRQSNSNAEHAGVCNAPAENAASASASSAPET